MLEFLVASRGIVFGSNCLATLATLSSIGGKLSDLRTESYEPLGESGVPLLLAHVQSLASPEDTKG